MNTYNLCMRTEFNKLSVAPLTASSGYAPHDVGSVGVDRWAITRGRTTEGARLGGVGDGSGREGLRGL